MTIRPRVARSVRDLRSRLRDLAAASHADSLAAREQSHETLRREQQALDDHLDTAEQTLAGARSVHDVELFFEDTGVHRIAIEDASTRLAEATQQTQVSEAALRARARQLRAAERIVDKLEGDHARRESVAEQRANDDISARRR